MGIDRYATEFLVSAAGRGVSFERTCTIGRQGLHVDVETLNRILRKRRVATIGPSAFAEPLLEVLGAKKVESLDYSSFEGATIVHDLNSAKAPAGSFSTVLDGGTLEHVFHIPNALRTMMSLVEVGGHLLLMSPTDAESGHGFYQFSAEFFYRSLSGENGYDVERCLLKEVGKPWFEVPDPAAVMGRRIRITARKSAYLYVQARRVAECQIFATPPLQSDYVTAWEKDGDERSEDLRGLARRLTPPAVKRAVNAMLPHRHLRRVRL